MKRTWYLSLLLPVFLTTACNSGNASSSVASKSKATHPENQEYFEKTGYDPVMPLKSYDDYPIKKMLSKNYFYARSVINSWGSMKERKLTFYAAKFNDNLELLEKKNAEKHFTQITRITNKFFALFYILNGRWMNTDGKKPEIIPYLELYDFHHKRKLKQAKEDVSYDPATNTWGNGWTNPFPYLKT